MLRSSAKNHASVTVVVDSADYQLVLDELNTSGNTTLETRKKLALKTFEHTAQYDGAIANYLGREDDGFSNTLNLQFVKSQVMRYGENPHQSAAFYKETILHEASVSSSNQIQGKPLSFNNLLMLMQHLNVFEILMNRLVSLLNTLIHAGSLQEKAFFQPIKAPIKLTQHQRLEGLLPLTVNWTVKQQKLL